MTPNGHRAVSLHQSGEGLSSVLLKTFQIYFSPTFRGLNGSRFAVTSAEGQLSDVKAEHLQLKARIYSP